MHAFQTVADIRIDAGRASRLNAYVNGLTHNKRIAVITDMDAGRSGAPRIDAMKGIKSRAAVPATLADVGINGDAIPMMAKDAMTEDRLLRNNAREMTYDATVEIYEAIL